MEANDNNTTPLSAIVASKPSLLASFLGAINQIYLKLPLNFSTLTGWRYPHIPRLLGNPILGRAPHFLRDNGVLSNLLAAGKLAENHSSGMCYYWLGNKLVLVVTKPEHLHQLLIENNQNICRGPSFKIFKTFMGSNITVDPPETWKQKKDIYGSWLSKAPMLAQHEEKMQALVKKYLAHLDANQNQAINLEKFLNGYTLEALLHTVMVPGGAQPQCKEKLLEYHEYVTKEVFDFINVFKWLMPSFVRRLVFKDKQTVPELKCKMHQALDNALLTPNETSIKTTENFIHSIYNLSEHKKDERLITDKSVFGDTNMLLLAGQDTTLTTLQFLIKLLCAHPNVATKLHNELKEHLQGQEFTLANINKVTYLDMIVKETLRLYPPVLFIPRDVAQDFVLGDAPLKKGDTVIFSPYLTHRLASLWEDPELFKPERFDKNNKIMHQAYLPFGAGANICIGQHFAWQEIKLLIAAIYLNYNVKIENNDFEISLAQGALKPKATPIARFIPLK